MAKNRLTRVVASTGTKTAGFGGPLRRLGCDRPWLERWDDDVVCSLPFRELKIPFGSPRVRVRPPPPAQASAFDHGRARSKPACRLAGSRVVPRIRQGARARWLRLIRPRELQADKATTSPRSNS